MRAAPDAGALLRRVLSPALAALLLLTPFAVARFGPPDDAAAAGLGAAQVWLPTDGSTDVALIDGPSAGLVDLLGVTGADLSGGLSQAAGVAYTVAPGGGAVDRISGVTQQASRLPVRGLPGSVRLSASATALHAYPVGGRLVRVHDGSLGRGTELPARAVVAATARGPAVVDPVEAVVRWFDDDVSTERATARIDRTPLPPGPRVAGDPANGDVYLVTAATGAVTVCRFEGSCRLRATLPAPSRRAGPLGAPVVAAGRLLVPEPAAGRVWVVNPAGAVTALPVFASAGDFELVSQQGYAFANSVASENAAVISPLNVVTPVLKRPATPPSPEEPEAGPTSDDDPAADDPEPVPPTPTGSATVPATAPATDPGATGTTGTTNGPGAGGGNGAGGGGAGGGGGKGGGGGGGGDQEGPGGPTPYRPSADDVELSVASGTTVLATATVRVGAPDGYAFYLVVGVNGVFYAQQRFTSSGSWLLEFPEDADLSTPRTAQVVVATGTDRARLDRELGLDPACRPPLDGLPGTPVSRPAPFTPDGYAGPRKRCSLEPDPPPTDPSPTTPTTPKPTEPGPTTPAPKPTKTERPEPEPTKTPKPEPEPEPTKPEPTEPDPPPEPTKPDPPGPEPTKTPPESPGPQ